MSKLIKVEYDIILGCTGWTFPDLDVETRSKKRKNKNNSNKKKSWKNLQK